MKNITDSERFWNTIKPFLTGKGVNSQKLTLLESNQILSADIDVAETLNSFFSDAPKSLSINENSYIINDTLGITDPIDIDLKSLNHTPVFLR